MPLLTKDNFEELKKSGKDIQDMYDLIKANATLVKSTTGGTPSITETILASDDNVFRFFFSNKADQPFLYFVDAENRKENWGYQARRDPYNRSASARKAGIETYSPQNYKAQSNKF